MWRLSNGVDTRTAPKVQGLAFWLDKSVRNMMRIYHVTVAIAKDFSLQSASPSLLYMSGIMFMAHFRMPPFPA